MADKRSIRVSPYGYVINYNKEFPPLGSRQENPHHIPTQGPKKWSTTDKKVISGSTIAKSGGQAKPPTQPTPVQKAQTHVEPTAQSDGQGDVNMEKDGPIGETRNRKRKPQYSEEPLVTMQSQGFMLGVIRKWMTTRTVSSAWKTRILEKA